MERIIGTVKERGRRPVLAALLSFFFTGLGQWYCGEAARAVVLLLLRLLPILCLPFIPFYAQGGRVLCAFAVMLVASLAIWLGASIDAFFLARNRSIVPGLAARPWAYLLFALLSLICTAGALMPARATYGLYVQRDDAMGPLLRRGDVLLVGRFIAGPPAPGSVLVYREGEREMISRVAAQSADRVAASGSMLAVRGEFLPLGIYNDSEVRSLGLTNSTELFYEVNGGRKYPVKGDSGSGRIVRYRGPSNEAGPGRIFVADDNRLGREWFHGIAIESITGRVEGLIWGGSPGRSMMGVFVDKHGKAVDMNRVNILD
ncbi:MAG TPA: hypothetical protein PKO25_02670 [Spirochaetota bacterium]|nr:hypothetical protein [Spirochaetota bacterium]